MRSENTFSNGAGAMVANKNGPVRAIPGVMDFFDYSPAASGMTYRHEFDGRGAPRIDGVPESPTPGRITWESVDGPQGSLGIVHSFNIDFALNWSSYYFDKQTPGTGEETQCTGDGSSYGASGTRVVQGLPNTDPTLGTANRLSVTRSLFYDSPGKANGAARKAQVANPLRATLANWP